MGTHDDLLDLNGEYRKMWDIQSADKKMDSGKEPKQNSVGILLDLAACGNNNLFLDGSEAPKA